MGEESFPTGIYAARGERLATARFACGCKHKVAVAHRNAFGTVVLQLPVAAAVAVLFDVPVVCVEGGAVEVVIPDGFPSLGVLRLAGEDDL